MEKIDLKPDPREVKSNGSKYIFLTVKVGNGDFGGNYVTLNDEFLVKGSFTNPVLLGPVEIFGGKKLRIQTNVLDNSPLDIAVITTEFKNENGVVLFSSIDQGPITAGGIVAFFGNYMII